MAYFHTTVVDNHIKALDTIGSVSGAICTFDTDRAERLVKCVCNIPYSANGYTDIDILHYSENLFISMPTATNDGITTSYDSNTGLISIRNDSRTTNYGYGSQRGIVASGLNPSHTYKFFFYPNVLGVTLSNTGSIELDNPFTGYSTAVLRVTSQYDFVNVHPIGDITTVRLFIFDLTDGSLLNISENFGTTIYGGEFEAVTGTLTEKYNADGTEKIPVIIQLHGNEINAFNGTNNIYADTGDIIDLKFVLSVGQAIS